MASENGHIEPDASQGIVTKPDTEKRLGEVEDLSQNILTLVVVSLVGIVIAVVLGIGTLILDQLHFNSEVYRDKVTHTNTQVTTDYVRVQPVIFPNLNTGNNKTN